MPMTPEEKEGRQRERLLDKAKEYQTSTYVRKFVAPLFQKMIRAEAGAEMSGTQVVIVDGELDVVERKRGQCACVTCGTVKAWDSGLKGMHCGHFIASRRNSILFEEDNVAPQCSHCNYYGSGRAQEFRKWMLEIRGLAVVERIEKLKTESRQFDREELVDLRMWYAARLKAAEQLMKAPERQPMNTIRIADLSLDADTQATLKTDESLVERYEAALEDAEDGWIFPPIDVFHDAGDYWVADGFHRTLAAARLLWEEVPCVVHEGTAADAYLFGVERNSKHGQPLNQADRRNCVIRLLKEREQAEEDDQRTTIQIAAIAGVNRRTVHRIFNEIYSPQEPEWDTVPAEQSSSEPDWSTDEEEEVYPTGVQETAEGQTEQDHSAGLEPNEKAILMLRKLEQATGRYFQVIDVYRGQFPGPAGDKVLEDAKKLCRSFDAWMQVLK